MDPGEGRVASAVPPMAAESPGMKLITPGGRPASMNACITIQFEKTAVDAGFQRTVLPASAGAIDRLPPMAVKLKGEMASTKPSRARYSILFHVAAKFSGWIW